MSRKGGARPFFDGRFTHAAGAVGFLLVNRHPAVRARMPPGKPISSYTSKGLNIGAAARTAGCRLTRRNPAAPPAYDFLSSSLVRLVY